MRPTQDFNTQNLLWMRGRKLPSSILKSAPTSLVGWKQLSAKIEEEIARNIFKFDGIFASSASGKPALSTSSASDSLVLRKINDNIRRAYGIRQAQRAKAVKLAKVALGEWTPKGVVTVDLKSCFESITPRDVIEKLKADGLVSSQTVHLLEIFFKQARKFGSNKYQKGLPRGILISSTMAELYLKGLDFRISKTPGLYVYIRYVDDILALSAIPSADLLKLITDIVTSQGLALNSTKSKTVDAGCKCSFTCKHAIGACPCKDKCKCQESNSNYEAVDYLGYKLVFKTGSSLMLSAPCYALISDSKCSKIKKRIGLAVADFRKFGDIALLEQRVRFLTSNVTVDQSLKSSKLLSGIAYTYEQYSPPPHPHPFSSSTLEHLDKFLRTQLRKLSVSHSLSFMQRRALIRHSFVNGHGKKHRSVFTPVQIRKIRSCWKDG
ncbi:hypothetical protein FHT04_003008 [Xanthomonas campestris]|nr:hypothetical protein [Xanthomonas cannabis]